MSDDAQVPPPDQLQFDSFVLAEEYKRELYEEFPYYTAEEIVGTFLGHNPYFPSQVAWENARRPQRLFRKRSDSEEMTPE
tara:strand:- start:81 stop:320 length:240 start_codon:yes stop_codon:yes gene_type:complete